VEEKTAGIMPEVGSVSHLSACGWGDEGLKALLRLDK